MHEKIFTEKSTIILGESHFAFIDHNLVDTNTISLSFPGDPYYSMYQKLKEVKKHSQLKRVFLVYTYADISPVLDNVLEIERFSYDYSRRNYSISSLFEQLEQSKRWQDVLKVYSRFNLTLNYDYLRSYYAQTKTTPFYNHVEERSDTTLLKNVFDFYKNNKRIVNFTKKHTYPNRVKNTINSFFGENKVPDENIKYLYKIANFCKEHDLVLYLVNTPLEKYYLSEIPTFFKEKHIQIKDDIIGDFSNVHYLDYSNFFQDPSYFQDQEHMGGYAGVLISLEFAKEIQKEIRN